MKKVISFAAMTFSGRLTSLAVRGNGWSTDVQTVADQAHTEYVQSRITDDNETSNPDFDAVARLLNAVRSVTLGTAKTLSQYFQAHGPYLIEYTADEKNNNKMRFYVKRDKGTDAKPFKEMTLTWKEWEAPKVEAELKGEGDLLKWLKSVANDKDNKRWDAVTSSDAAIAINAIETVIAGRPAAIEDNTEAAEAA